MPSQYPSLKFILLSLLSDHQFSHNTFRLLGTRFLECDVVETYIAPWCVPAFLVAMKVPNIRRLNQPIEEA